MRREARLLKAKAVASVRRSAQAFNTLDDDGRVTSVLLHLQHAFEMLLKAGLAEHGVKLFDPKTGRSIGFAKCVNLARAELKLDDEACGTLRVIDAMRDDEQHYLGSDDEGLLYLHARAGITLFDDLLQLFFGEALADHLPTRVLPISTEPPANLDVLIDKEFTQIAELLRPAKRRRAEARSKIRALLAMEALRAEDVEVSERDVDRVEQGIRGGKTRDEVFPRLADVTTVVHGAGVNITVRFTKKEGAPVKFIAADDPTEAAAVREVDLQRKYRYSRKELAAQLGVTTKRSSDIRKQLGIEDDPACMHEFVFGASKHPMFSDEALIRMRSAFA